MELLSVLNAEPTPQLTDLGTREVLQKRKGIWMISQVLYFFSEVSYGLVDVFHVGYAVAIHVANR